MALLVALLAKFLATLLAVTGLLIVGLVLLQTRGAGLGAFSDSGGQNFYKRRGGELFLFRATIVVSIVFVIASLASLLIR